MARGRTASKIQKKLNFLCFGEPFSGKSTFASQFAFMKNEDGSPMRVLYIDAESGSIDNYLDDMEENGIDLRNIYILYTQSLGEVLDYIDKVKNGDDLYEISEDGEEMDTIVLDAEGRPFRADAIVIDGVTVLHTSAQQGLLEFYKGANLCLALLGTGVHSLITCRSTDEKKSVKGENGQFNSIPTGRKIPAGFKDLDYNTHTVIHFYRDEFDNVVADVQKDRSNVHPKEIITDPSLLDWQVVIDGNKGKDKFVLRNNLDTAVQTEQEIYSAEVMSNATKSLSKSEMEKVKASSSVATPSGDIASLRASINASISKMTSDQKAQMKAKLEEEGLPTQFKKETDPAVLNRILELIAE